MKTEIERNMSMLAGRGYYQYKFQINGRNYTHPNKKITGSEVKVIFDMFSNAIVYLKINGNSGESKIIADNEYVVLSETELTYFYFLEKDILIKNQAIQKRQAENESKEKIINYLTSEYNEGKRKFIISFPYEGEKHFIIHADGENGRTLDVYL